MLILEFIHKASEGGHDGSTYAFVLIFLYLNGKYRQQGVKTIGEIESTQKQRK